MNKFNFDENDVGSRYGAACNVNCPVDVLAKLAEDESRDIRCAVEKNPNCPNELKIKLASEEKDLLERIGTLPDEFILGSLRERTFSKKLRLWQSKIGGFPYFPKGNKYPVDPNGKPPLLLVQINFADVPKLDMFPEKGILQIYLGDADGFPYGLNLDDGMDQSYFRVLYCPEVMNDKDALVTDFEFLPTDRNNLPCSDIAPIKFDLKYGPISKGDYLFDQMILDGCDEDDAYEIREVYQEKKSSADMAASLAAILSLSKVIPGKATNAFPQSSWIMESGR